MDWGAVISIAAVNIALMTWIKIDISEVKSDTKNDIRTIISVVNTMKDEMAKERMDFHGKLERQDADFKSHMIYYHNDKS